VDPANIYAATANQYPTVRRPDPRIARQLAAAVGPGRVLNVGAGSGSYERETGVFAAVEPSPAMLRRRPRDGAAAVRGRAEELPFADGSFAAALAVLTTHHWSDLRRGLAEMSRVSGRLVILTWDPSFAARFWLMDYLPAALVAWDLARFLPVGQLLDLLPGAHLAAVPIAHDCTDGFLGAYWRRPEAYLSRAVRQGMSSLAAWEDRLTDVWPRLEADLRSGAWRARHGDLLALDEIDLGYRLVTSTVSDRPGRDFPRGSSRPGE
jgi:SAM-dependent methyltransferase